MTLARVGSPVAMGALTTFLAGSVMQLFSSILAYVQIGTFLMVLSVVSWLFSTLFHLVRGFFYMNFAFSLSTFAHFFNFFPLTESSEHLRSAVSQ